MRNLELASGGSRTCGYIGGEWWGRGRAPITRVESSAYGARIEVLKAPRG